MAVRDRYIFIFLYALYFLVGISLFCIVLKITKDFYYSMNYIIGDKFTINENFIITIKLGIIICIIILYLIVSIFVRCFMMKKSDLISDLIYLLLASIVLEEICLSIIYISHNDHINSVLKFMKNDSKFVNNSQKATENWYNYQTNIQCCGVYTPLEYTNDTISRSCCSDENCNTAKAYITGCFSKVLANFSGKYQLLIWNSIVFNTLSILALYLLRHSESFSVQFRASESFVVFYKPNSCKNLGRTVL